MKGINRLDVQRVFCRNHQSRYIGIVARCSDLLSVPLAELRPIAGRDILPPTGANSSNGLGEGDCTGI